MRRRSPRARGDGNNVEESGMKRVLGDNPVGRISTEFVVGNYVDVELAREGKLEPAMVRKVTISGVVDSGATRLVLPQALVKRLGLRVKGKTRVKYASGQTAMRD